MALRLNPALREFWRTRAKIKVLKGGRMSSKTHDAAGMAIFLARNYSVKFLCIRQFQAKMSQSVYSVLVDKIAAAGWEDEFTVIKSLDNAIIHKKTGSSFSFYGMARNTAEIKGFEGADICWIEEGEGLTFEQWKVIKPTIRRKSGAEMWLIYNPRLVSDFVESSPIFKHDPDNGTIVRKINFDENPFLPPDVLEDIENDRRLLDEDEFDNIYNGNPLTDDDNVIIKRSWIMAAIDAHKALPELDWEGDMVRAGFDVADSGKDKCAMVEMDGHVCNYVDEWKAREDELLKSSARVYNRAVISGAFVRYDSIGVGAGVGAHFNEMNDERHEENRNFNGIGFAKFNAGAAVIDPDEPYVNNAGEQITNKEFFSNLKAQAWWLVADRFRNTYNAVKNGMEFDVSELISIDKDVHLIEQLVTELSTPNRSYDKSGRVKVESKDELLKREVPSPNIADAFLMSNAPKEGGLTLFDVL